MSVHPSLGIINPSCLLFLGNSAITAPITETFQLFTQLPDKPFSFQTIRTATSVSMRIPLFVSFSCLS